MIPLLQFIHWLLGVYSTVLIVAVIMSWLVSFNVINTSNQFVRIIYNGLYRLTEPVFGRIRRYMPDLGGIDISPIIAIIGIYFIQSVVINGWLIPIFAGQ